ncbi:MAG: cytochrome c maturation protein CcmE [Bacteroidota bacterium]|jgi:cytochrome c-type biogenesis protein CcmE
MNKTSIALLVLIAAAIVVLISYTGDLTTYETIASAKERPGKFVNLVAKIDTQHPIEYDPVKNPNYLSFTAIDSLGSSIRVIYRNNKPTDMEKSDRLVLKGKVVEGQFECKDILMKCPSKYKDAPNQALTPAAS